MGLDILALSNVKYVGCDIDEEDDRSEWYVSGCDGQNDLKPGCYTETDQTECHSFRAGSYSWYNHWRDHLAYAIHEVTPDVIWENPEKYRGRPFYELIDFSDCEGAIGPAFSAKLARDFAEHAEHIRQYIKNPVSADCLRHKDPIGLLLGPDTGPLDQAWFLEKYRDWHKAFELAAQAGVVFFG